MIIKSEYDEAKYNQGLNDALDGKKPVMPDDESYMKGYNESSKINNYPDKGIDVKASRKIQPSHQITSAKSSWKQFIKGLDKLEKRDELKNMYNSAHWEFLDYIMPCDLEWTEEMEYSDFDPLTQIYFLFHDSKDIEEFLFECTKENIPGAKEKLQRIREINNWDEPYEPSSLSGWDIVKSSLVSSSRRIQSMRTPKNVYLNEDTQKLIQRLEKRVGHELKLKFEEGNTPYVEIEKLPKGGYSFITKGYLNKLAENFLYDGYKEKQDSFIVYLDPAIMYTRPEVDSSRQIKSELDDKTVRNVELQRKYDDIVNRLAEEERIWNKNHPDKAHYFYNKPEEIKSSIITPWDTNQVTGTSDEDLGLSAVVDIYGNEFVNVDESTLNELKDTLVRYFDDEAYVRDWNINNPDYQIEDAFEVTDPEEMNVEDLARYFDYEAYGRDIRLEDNMVWDSENQYWVSAHDVNDE